MIVVVVLLVGAFLITGVVTALLLAQPLLTHTSGVRERSGAHTGTGTNHRTTK